MWSAATHPNLACHEKHRLGNSAQLQGCCRPCGQRCPWACASHAWLRGCAYILLLLRTHTGLHLQHSVLQLLRLIELLRGTLTTTVCWVLDLVLTRLIQLQRRLFVGHWLDDSLTVQERGVYKAKWQQLLSQHTSAQSTIERLQRDVQHLQDSHADLQQVNRSLESRLLGHRPTTASHSPDRGTGAAASRPVGRSYDMAVNSHGGLHHGAAQSPYPEHLPVGRSGAEQSSSWGSTSNLDRVLAEHRGRVAAGPGQAFEHSAMSLSAEEADSETQEGCLSSEEIMARLTRSPPDARDAAGNLSLCKPDLSCGYHTTPKTGQTYRRLKPCVPLCVRHVLKFITSQHSSMGCCCPCQQVCGTVSCQCCKQPWCAGVMGSTWQKGSSTD